MNRKPIVAGNWKMNKGGPGSAAELAGSLLIKLKALDWVDVFLCPPFPVLGIVGQAIKGSAVGLGAQNCYSESSGAFTGEISVEFLKSLGCTACILGHSERRTLMGESDDFINRKVKLVLQAGLIPILCCGETEQERREAVTEAVLKRHILEGLKGVSSAEASRVVIAYEPVWAIGTGKTARPEDAEEMHRYIRGLLGDLFGEQIAETMRIQYGGSMNAENAAELMAQPNIDGGLIGGASLKADAFNAIVEAAAKSATSPVSSGE